MAKTKKEKSLPEGRAIAVTAQVARRRAGRAFGPEPVILVVADLGEEEVEALLDDPMLSIKPAELPEPETPADA